MKIISAMASRDSRDVELLLAGVTVTDEPLATRLRRGDPAALEAMALEHAPGIERLLARLLGPRADLEDLVQTVFLEACRALPRFRGESSVSTFLAGIAVRVARRAMRPTAWWRRRGAMPEELAAHGVDPERSSIAQAQLASLHRALGAIAPKKRIAFLLWALEGMEPRAIADLVGASLPATRSRIFQAQRELRALASEDEHLRELIGGGDRGT